MGRNVELKVNRTNLVRRAAIGTLKWRIQSIRRLHKLTQIKNRSCYNRWESAKSVDEILHRLRSCPSRPPINCISAYERDICRSGLSVLKIYTNGVDGPAKWANLVTPRDSGIPLIGSSFYVHLGLQIGLNFVPGFEFRICGKQIVRARD